MRMPWFLLRIEGLLGKQVLWFGSAVDNYFFCFRTVEQKLALLCRCAFSSLRLHFVFTLSTRFAQQNFFLF